MSKYIVLDIETFRYDLLLGIKDLQTGKHEYYWNSDIKPALDRILKDDPYIITYNGEHYDIPILFNYFYNPRNQASFFQLSKLIVEDNLEITYPLTFVKSIDLMASLLSYQSLKLVEAILGWEIRETTISFDHEYKLTEEERREVEHYSVQDLDATEALYNKMSRYFNLRIKLAEYLEVEHDYRIPLPTMMGIGLGAHRQLHEPYVIDPKLYDVPIKSEVKDILLNHMLGRKPGLSYTFEIQGVSYTVGDGGIHSNREPINETNVFHIDVKGYYTLIQILFNLFSRNIPPEGIRKVVHMYFERLKLGGSDFSNMSNILRDKIKIEYPETYDYVFGESVPRDPVTALAQKIGILSIWGAMRNRFHILFDFDVGFLVTLYGQYFMIYLIELLADKGIDILNANTDGLIVTGDLEVIQKEVDSWQEYTGFDVEVNQYNRFVAKDVNNYIMGNSLKDLTVKGRDFSGVRDWLYSNIIVVPQTPVISKILSELLFYDVRDPEEYVKKRIQNFEPLDYMFISNHTLKFQGMFYLENGERLQRTNRVYAHKGGGTVYKFKGPFAQHKLVYVEERVHYTDKVGKQRYKTIKGYVKESNEELFYETEGLQKEKILENPSTTADGKKVLYMYGDNQYKYPGLPLVKTLNEDVANIKTSDLDIDYDYYVKEILRRYEAYQQ